MSTEYIFLLCMNNAGTTVMSQYLASQIDAYLPPFGNNEGQTAPAVREMMRRRPWSEGTKFDWAFIKAEWDKLRIESGKTTFIEASPPNIMRLGQIRSHFDAHSTYVFSISNPYVQIASCAYNYLEPPLTRRSLRKTAEKWLEKAEKMITNMSENPDIPLVKYEDFCTDPTAFNRALNLPVQDDVEISGKRNTRITEIKDQTYKNVAFFDESEINLISSALAERADVVEHFGYEIRDGADLLNAAARDYPQVHSGLVRRARWEGNVKARQGLN